MYYIHTHYVRISVDVWSELRANLESAVTTNKSNLVGESKNDKNRNSEISNVRERRNEVLKKLSVQFCCLIPSAKCNSHPDIHWLSYGKRSREDQYGWLVKGIASVRLPNLLLEANSVVLCTIFLIYRCIIKKKQFLTSYSPFPIQSARLQFTSPIFLLASITDSFSLYKSSDHSTRYNKIQALFFIKLYYLYPNG